MKMFLMTQTVSVSLKQFFPIGYYLTTKRHNNYSKSNPAINFKFFSFLSLTLITLRKDDCCMAAWQADDSRP